MRRAVAFALGLLASSTAAGRARGEGLLLAPGDLDTSARASLVQAVAQARRVEPGAFETIAALRERVEAAARAEGKRSPSIRRELTALGAAAVPAILSELSVDGARWPMSDAARDIWLRELLGGLTALGGPAGVPVLEQLVARRADGFLVVRAAAEALAVHDTERAARSLVAASLRGSPRRRLAVLAGMGACRRRAVAERLVLALSASRGEHDAVGIVRHLARALGTLGDAAAWEEPGRAQRVDAGAIRGMVADALVRAFAVEEDPANRRALTRALLAVDEASTERLVRAESDKADPATRARLDELARRLQRNPLR